MPILPRIKLSEQFSKKKNCILFDYIDIPNNVLLEIPPKTKKTEIYFYKPTNNFLPRCIIMKKYKTKLDNIPLFIPYKNKFKIIADNVCSKMKKPLMTIHVRRGDYIPIHNSLKENTSPEHIRDVIKKYKFNSVYIMTNEKDKDFFNQLRNDFNIFQYFDFKDLVSIYDNYELYAIETFIMFNSNFRISTFDTTNSEKKWL